MLTVSMNFYRTRITRILTDRNCSGDYSACPDSAVGPPSGMLRENCTNEGHKADLRRLAVHEGGLRAFCCCDLQSPWHGLSSYQKSLKYPRESAKSALHLHLPQVQVSAFYLPPTE